VSYAPPTAAQRGPLVGAGGTPGEIDGMRITGELGRGARTVVLRAVRGDTAYALKVLTSAREDAATAGIAFRREAALLAAVDHPGLPRVHAVGEFRGRPYLVMDLVEGRSLAEELVEGRLSRDAAVRVAVEVGGALAALHANGLIHRDIKPGNVIIRPDGSAQLIDFGLAGHEADSYDGQVVGTLLYASPEQSGSFQRPVDSRSDLYSLGVVLFECLTGRPPFDSADIGELLRRHAVVPPPDPREFGVEVDEPLRSVLFRLLAKDPDDRHPDTPTALRELASLISGTSAGVVDLEPPLIGRDAELARLPGPGRAGDRQEPARAGARRAGADRRRTCPAGQGKPG
jgi:serine/threonine protein kinase